MRPSAPRVLLLVFALALVVRIAGIDHFPPGLWMDEGLNGVDAWRTLHDTRLGPATGFQLVYPDIFPREPLLVWLQSLALAVGGPRVIVMRLTMALVGSLACALFFLAVLGADHKRGLAFALLAAFVLCTLHWHAHFSRIVFRTNFVPLIACSVVALLAWSRHFSHKEAKAAALVGAGILTALGFYTYLSWWFFLPVLLIWWWALRPRLASGKLLQTLDVYLIPFLALILPLVLHYLRAPDDLTGRPSAVSPLRDGLGPGIQLMARNLLDVLLMFSVRGDHVLLHNVAANVPQGHPDFGRTGTPALDPFLALFFHLGVLRALLDLRGKEARRRSLPWLAWLLCMLMPSVVSQTDSVNTLRTLGTTPAVAWMVAHGFWWGREMLLPRFGKSAGIALVVVLIAGGGWQVHKLWWRHPRTPGIEMAFSGLHVALSDLCRPVAGTTLFVPTDYANHKTFQFLTIGRDDIHPLDPVALLRGNGSDHRVLCTALSPDNTRALRNRFPGASMEAQPLMLMSPDGAAPRPFAWIVRIPGALLLSEPEAKDTAQSLQLVTER